MKKSEAGFNKTIVALYFAKNKKEILKKMSDKTEENFRRELEKIKKGLEKNKK